VSAGRFKAIDALRRRSRFDASVARIAEELDAGVTEPEVWDGDAAADDLADDRLRLIFTCCAASSWTINSSTPLAPICAGGWDGSWRRVTATGAPSTSPGSSPSGAFSNGDSSSCGTRKALGSVAPDAPAASLTASGAPGILPCPRGPSSIQSLGFGA
jgi:hypothetical protein